MNKSLALKDACFLLLLSIFVMAALPSVAQNFWAGTWETHWATGSARMLLSQDGSRVSGSYPLLSGQIEAAAEGKLLRGRWSEDKKGRQLRIHTCRGWAKLHWQAGWCGMVDWCPQPASSDADGGQF